METLVTSATSSKAAESKASTLEMMLTLLVLEHKHEPKGVVIRAMSSFLQEELSIPEPMALLIAVKAYASA